MNKTLSYVKRFFRFLLNAFTRRLWLKMLSLLLALLVWAYIISVNTSLTRTKTFSSLSVESGSVTELSAKTLALATDIHSEYAGKIDVTVEVPQSRYAQLTSDNITLTPDFSGINSVGKYEVPLRGNSTYGTVTRISPSTIQVTVEDLISRDITAELEIVNEDEENYWYNTANFTLNPKTITVRGPASLMRSVSRAVVQVDVSGRSSTIRRGYTTVSLMDANDSEIPTQLLTLSTRASIVNLEIYPKKRLEVSVDESLLHVPEGYEIVSVTVQPDTVVIAAGSDLLSQMESLSVDVGDVQDFSGSHSLKLLMHSDVKYYSASEVTLTVTTRRTDAEGEEDE